MKFAETMVVFREIPDEIALAINISNCPVGCPGCHSKYLAQDIGETLDRDSLRKLIEGNPGISCVSFMGGDADPKGLVELSLWVRETWPALKTCWYSGRTMDVDEPYVSAFNYVKVGPYIEERGPLDSPTTNQRFYSVSVEQGRAALVDLTHRFTRR